MSRPGWAAVAALSSAGLLTFVLSGGGGTALPEPEADPASPGATAPAAEPAARVATVSDEGRCRCAPLDLAEYWAMAEEVALARLVDVEVVESSRVFQMVLEAPPWKTDRLAAVGRLAAGDTVEYRTAVSTATCGVQPDMDAIYVLFGQRAEAGESPRVDSCSGTRVHRSAAGDGEPGGFQDVPGRFVVRQLDALGGLDALAGLAPLPDPADPEYAVLRGLLDLEPLAHGGVVRIFAEPEPTAAVIATITSHDAVETLEVGYEVAAAVVFGRVDGWARVRLTDGRAGWIAPDEAGTWFPYLDLPLRRLAYLTPLWSGYVWPDPGAGIPVRVGPVDRQEAEQPVEVLESRLVGGFPWFRVSILGGSPCEASAEVRPVAGGWVPGYGRHSDSPGPAPTIWYWSRGC